MKERVIDIIIVGVICAINVVIQKNTNFTFGKSIIIAILVGIVLKVITYVIMNKRKK